MTLAQQEILFAVCSEYNAKPTQVLGTGRNQHIVKVRRDIAEWMRDEGYTLPQIGHALNRHHSSIMNLIYGKQR